MIVVELIKQDAFMGKIQTKTWSCPSEENARARASAFASVHKCSEQQVREEKDEHGNLTRIVVDCRPPAPGPSKEELRINELEERISQLETRLQALEKS